MRTKKVKSTGRLGSRYGRKIKIKLIEVESVQRKKQGCTFCDGTAERLSKGIWKCKKCKKKFADHAYFLPKKEE